VKPVQALPDPAMLAAALGLGTQVAPAPVPQLPN
jgi:hypothetical protein